MYHNSFVTIYAMSLFYLNMYLNIYDLQDISLTYIHIWEMKVHQTIIQNAIEKLNVNTNINAVCAGC